MVAASPAKPFLTFAALAALSLSAIAENIPFPAGEFETSLLAIPAEQAAGEAKSPPDAWKVSVSWPTETSRRYVIEARMDGGEWTAHSEPFEGDGRPVDFIDRVHEDDLPIVYRLVSHRSSDTGDARISKMSVGFGYNRSAEVLTALLEFHANSDFLYEIQTSFDSTFWRSRAAVAENPAAEVSIEDPGFAAGTIMHYRILAYKIDRRTGVAPSRITASAISDGRLLLPPVATSERPEETSLRREAAQRNSLRNPHRIVRSIRFTVRKKTVPAGTQYAVIELGSSGDGVGINDHLEILFSEPRSDGRADMIVWIAGERHNLSEMTGVRFHRVLDIDDTRAVVGSLFEDGQEKVLGFRYTPRKGAPPKIKPLTAEELANFRFEKMEPVFEGDVFMDGRRYSPTADGKGLRLKPEE